MNHRRVLNSIAVVGTDPSIRNVIAWTFIYIGIFVLGMEAVDKVSFGGVGPGLGIAMIGLIWLAAPFWETYFSDRRSPR